MADNVHVDYAEVMKDRGSIVFSYIYEKAMINKQKSFLMKDDLAKRCSDKRKFGLEKYGEHSFQSNLQNCIASPTIVHAQEETIDLINYLMHESYKRGMLNLDSTEIDVLLRQAISMYERLSSIEEVNYA